ncbi:TonB-dependent receptor plug domain-containing protein [Marinobacter persicus]|uniref:Iron complex outermembrane receptor protein n=1 Tax=Marinobacter persicus TaxID=930118 RepID=A0A2S6G544_9GAMM|nr:TonB-dependent receptor [Marinobacter persicus]PPK50780.1 iron complex outermembrane receptor protein [Marinobacter persicus]PPK54232.1 iron complex outermembrane receptor protein [Marinobacter persicus]PPK57368.1 iron complex outermembrane receptor protein [Marinobacter persicus]
MTKQPSPFAQPIARYLPGIFVSTLAAVVGPAAAQEAPPEFDTSTVSFEEPVPEVLTTTRLRQPKTRVPGSTTIIEGSLIRDLGIKHLYEVFRLVPGMTVNFVGSHQPVVTYHGTSHYEQRRMQVLVDGRTAHRATLSDMDWESMPVPLEMIERIEVARGPNSAAYGINAFLGTINIITRDPADTDGVEAYVSRGSRGYERTFGSLGNTGEVVDWRLTLENRQFDGFGTKRDGNEFHDGHNLNFITWDSRATLNDQANLEFRTGMADGVNQEDPSKNGGLTPIENPDIELRDYYLQSRFNYHFSENHFFHIQAAMENFRREQRYRIVAPSGVVDCLLQGTPLYASQNCFEPSGNPGDPPALFTEINSDYEDARLELEIQDTLLVNPALKLVGGAGFRKDTLRSETYFNGTVDNYQSRYFGNMEYSPWNWLTLNVGGNWERTSTTDDSYFSPRVASNFVFNDSQALRFVYSEAVRTPDPFEQDPDYGYTLRNVSPDEFSELEGFRLTMADINPYPAQTTLGEDLEEENITSYEISYFGQFQMEEALLYLEVRGFRDELRDMIGGVIKLRDWTLANSLSANQQGFEIEAMLEYPATTLRASYAYLDQDTWYTGDPILDENGNVDTKEQKEQAELLERMSVTHSGSLAIIRDLPWTMKASAAYYWADQFQRLNEQFERIDGRLSKQFFGPKYNAELALTIQHYLNRDPEMGRDDNIDHHNQFFVEAAVRF